MDARQKKVAQQLIDTAKAERVSLENEKARMQSILASIDEKLADLDARDAILEEGFGKQIKEAGAVARL